MYCTCSGWTTQNVRGRFGCASHDVLYGLVLLFVLLQQLVEKPEKPTGDHQRNSMRAEISLIRLYKFQQKAFLSALKIALASINNPLYLSCDNSRKKLLLAFLESLRRKI